MTEDYLAEVADLCRAILGPALTGVYVCGSAAQGETSAMSDIDLIAVVEAPLSAAQKRDLAAVLDHAARPVPASALEIIFVSEATAKTPPRTPAMAFALTTGVGLVTETQEGEGYDELLIDMAACREKGRALFGPPPGEVFGAVNRRWLLEVMIANLEWHRTTILDPYHDLLGQNSALNAARSLCFAVEGRLVSKAEGGRWAMAREPLATAALRIRNGERAEALVREEVDAFLQRVISICRERL